MPAIEIAPETFTRLKTFAEPLVDDSDSVIRKILDRLDACEGKQKLAILTEGIQPTATSVRTAARKTAPTSFAIIDAASPPDLTGTKVLAATFANGRPSRLNWNQLLAHAVYRAISSCKPDEVHRIVGVQFEKGKKSGRGFQHFADLGISVQGQDANTAWKNILHIAQKLGCAVEVEFEWRGRPFEDGGRLEWVPPGIY